MDLPQAFSQAVEIPNVDGVVHVGREITTVAVYSHAQDYAGFRGSHGGDLLQRFQMHQPDIVHGGGNGQQGPIRGDGQNSWR